MGTVKRSKNNIAVINPLPPLFFFGAGGTTGMVGGSGGVADSGTSVADTRSELVTVGVSDSWMIVSTSADSEGVGSAGVIGGATGLTGMGLMGS